MPRKRAAADGGDLEWAIQSDYVEAISKLGDTYIFTVLEFHKGNAAGGKTFMTKGIPDTMVGYIKRGGGRGRLWIEFKRPGKKPTPDQEEIHRQLRRGGEEVLVMTDAGEAIDALLKRIGLM